MLVINMTEVALPNYTELNLALSHMLHPSEAHGLISGILCAHSKNTEFSWEELIGEKNLGKNQELLQKLYDGSAAQLEDFSFEFQLVLPTDSESLPVRAEALTLWCQGFLTGINFISKRSKQAQSTETEEIINDIVEIAKMNYEDVVASEEDEAAFVELVEYVRMAAISIYQERQDAIEANQNLH